MSASEHTDAAPSATTLDFDELRDARSVAGRTALVTGSASGIGRATATLLAAMGAKVAVADLSQEAVDEVVGSITSQGGEARGWRLDVTDAARVAAVVDEIRATLGPIDMLVNNAGVSVAAPMMSAEFADAWEHTMAVNLRAHATTVQACLADLTRNRDGRVVNIASTEGLGATAGLPAYTASKHGVIGLTKSMAVELAVEGVTVNAICPGPIDTGMTASIADDHKAVFAKRRVPLRRYGQPIELAHAVVNLLLPGSSYINGAVVRADGGMLARNA